MEINTTNTWDANEALFRFGTCRVAVYTARLSFGDQSGRKPSGKCSDILMISKLNSIGRRRQLEASQIYITTKSKGSCCEFHSSIIIPHLGIGSWGESSGRADKSEESSSNLHLDINNNTSMEKRRKQKAFLVPTVES